MTPIPALHLGRVLLEEAPHGHRLLSEPPVSTENKGVEDHARLLALGLVRQHELVERQRQLAQRSAQPVALGPLRGDGLQIVDVAKRRYANELRLFGGNARVTLEATFTGDAEELRVTFRSIRLVLFGNQIIEKQFPPGVERTWCLSYTDASCRVVRAGVDGGRSIVREAGLVDKNAGEAKDAYLFFMERAPDYVAD